MKSKRIKKQKNYYYSFLTLFLLFFTIYFSIVVIYNVIKIISYHDKRIKLEAVLEETKETKKLLNAEIESFKSAEANEAFLRNNLKYAAPDEILVIIVPAKKK